MLSVTWESNSNVPRKAPAYSVFGRGIRHSLLHQESSALEIRSPTSCQNQMSFQSPMFSLLASKRLLIIITCKREETYDQRVGGRLICEINSQISIFQCLTCV